MTGVASGAETAATTGATTGAGGVTVTGTATALAAGNRVMVKMSENSAHLARLLQSLLFNGTALFVFISGFLFAYLAPRYQWQGFMKKKALHVLLPYLVVSLPGILWRLTQLHHGVLPVDYVPAAVIDKPIPFVIWSLLTGFHIGPLWFVPFVCLLFLCSPLFHRLVASPALGTVTSADP